MHGKINKDVLYGLLSSIFNFINRSNLEKKYKSMFRGRNFYSFGKKHKWKRLKTLKVFKIMKGS